MTIEALVFWSFVVWRFTALLVYDSIMARFRELIGVKYNEYSECIGKNIVARALCCHKCTSIWVAILATLLIRPTLEMVIPIILALSAGSIVINKIANGE